MKDKRYVVTMAISVWAKDDKEALKKAKYIKSTQDYRYDNRPQILEVEAVEGITLRKLENNG